VGGDAAAVGRLRRVVERRGAGRGDETQQDRKADAHGPGSGSGAEARRASLLTLVPRRARGGNRATGRRAKPAAPARAAALPYRVTAKRGRMPACPATPSASCSA